MNLKKDLENSFSSNITKNLLSQNIQCSIDNVGFINSIAEGQLKVSKLDGPKGHSQQGLGQAPCGSQLPRGPELVGWREARASGRELNLTKSTLLILYSSLKAYKNRIKYKVVSLETPF